MRAAVTSKHNRSATTRCYGGAGVRHRNAQEGTTPARLSRPGDATVVGAQNGTAVACHGARIDAYKRHREKVLASATCLVVPVDASVFGPEDESSPSDADDGSNIGIDETDAAQRNVTEGLAGPTNTAVIGTEKPSLITNCKACVHIHKGDGGQVF